MTRAASLLLLLLLTLVACEGEPPTNTPPDGATVVPEGEPTLPPDAEIAPGSRLEERLFGECIPFDPWGDGNEVCIMTTPQDGTLGALTSEEEGLDGAGVGGATESLLDEPPSTLPESVDHRTEYLNGCLTVSHQFSCGWCAVHAAVSTLEALHCSKGCDVPELSESHLRSLSRDGRGFGSCARGWNTRTALNLVASESIVDYETWPYVPNGRGLNEARPSDAVLEAGAVHRATGSHIVDIKSLDAMRGELASQREVIISVPVYRDIVTKTGSDCASGSGATHRDWCSDTARVDVPPTEKPCSCGRAACREPMCLSGYHAIVLVGYDDATREFIFLNSWGKTWGESGYGRITYDFVTNYSRRGDALDDVDTDIPGNACEDDEGMMPPEDRCGEAGDCAACTGLSGCGWCSETDACIASADSGPCGNYYEGTCPVPPDDPCTSLTACDECTANDECDWCAGSARCYAPSRRTVLCYDPRNAADQCDDCRGAADCGACAGRVGCGWCPDARVGEVAPGDSLPGRCITGSDTDPDRVRCDAYRGTTDACTSDECSLITDCDTCLDQEHCGWCDGTDQCMLGGFFGPVGDETFGSTCGEDWDWFGPFCDNTDADCTEAGSCRECLRGGESCEWDETALSCFPVGTATGEIIASEGACPALCGGRLAPCDSAGDCCDGLACVNGDCVDCGGAGGVEDRCDPTEVGSCCGTLVCSRAAGGGETTCCRSGGDACGGDAECCGEMTCGVMGVCECRLSGESCVAGRDCCGGSFCDAGTCT